MKYRNSIVKYAKTMEYHEQHASTTKRRSYIYFWLRRYDGSIRISGK